MYNNQQPQGQAQMSMGGNRNPMNKPYNQEGEREWSHGLCDCCGDCGTCFVAWCCPCITYNQNVSRRKALESQGRPHPDGGDSCGSDCLVYTALGCFGFGWVLQIGERANLRRRYQIQGNSCGDCMVAWCCFPCSLTQESREIEGEERSFGGQKA